MNGSTRPVEPVGGRRVPLVDERPRHDNDGTTPFTDGGSPGTFQGRAGAAATATFVVVPFAGLGVAEPGQIDISAAVIRLFERLGWATGVHWPVPARLAARRRNPGQDQPQPALQP